jgi:hypothetical protein
MLCVVFVIKSRPFLVKERSCSYYRSHEEIVYRICDVKRWFQNDLMNGINKKRPFVKSGRIVCQIGVKIIGYIGADVDRFLGIDAFTVNRVAVSGDVSKV